MGKKQKGRLFHETWILCDPHWELICHNKWHPGILEISTALEIAIETHFHAWNGTKTTLLILPADRETFWLLHPSEVLLLSGGTVQPENTYSCILKVTCQTWETQKRISSKTNHSYYQCSTDVTIKSDSILTNLIGKDGVLGWLM